MPKIEARTVSFNYKTDGTPDHDDYNRRLNQTLSLIEKEGKEVMHMQQTQSSVGEFVHIFITVFFKTRPQQVHPTAFQKGGTRPLPKIPPEFAGPTLDELANPSNNPKPQPRIVPKSELVNPPEDPKLPDGTKEIK